MTYGTLTLEGAGGGLLGKGRKTFEYSTAEIAATRKRLIKQYVQQGFTEGQAKTAIRTYYPKYYEVRLIGNIQKQISSESDKAYYDLIETFAQVRTSATFSKFVPTAEYKSLLSGMKISIPTETGGREFRRLESARITTLAQSLAKKPTETISQWKKRTAGILQPTEYVEERYRKTIKEGKYQEKLIGQVRYKIQPIERTRTGYTEGGEEIIEYVSRSPSGKEKFFKVKKSGMKWVDTKDDAATWKQWERVEQVSIY
jgi:hypothetical protein